MTLKLSIWWIGLAVIFSLQIRDSQSQCGCSRGNNAPDVAGSQIKVGSPTRPDVQVGSSAFSVRDNIEKHPYKKPLDNTVTKSYIAWTVRSKKRLSLTVGHLTLKIL